MTDITTIHIDTREENIITDEVIHINTIDDLVINTVIDRDETNIIYNDRSAF